MLALTGGAIVIEHGHRFGFTQPCHDALRTEYSDARLIVYGHTHKQVIDKKQMPWICNPGVAGLVRNQGGPRCLLLDYEGDDGFKLVPFGFDRLNLYVAMLSNCDDPPQLIRGINGQFSIFVILCISGYEPFNSTTFTRIILNSIFKIIKFRIHR
jgi:hypothetical protein